MNPYIIYALQLAAELERRARARLKQKKPRLDQIYDEIGRMLR